MSSLTITALKLAAAINRVQQAKTSIDRAYLDWKHSQGLGFVERNSPAWKAMMVATSPQYMELQAAKSQERRWRKKLVQAAQEVHQ